MDDTAQSPQPGQQNPLASDQKADEPLAQAQQTQQPPFDNTQGVPPIQPVAPVQSQPVQISQPQVSVPTGGKEHEGTIVAEVQPTQPEIIVPEEVQEAGVEATPSEEPQLTDEHKEAGLEVAKESTPVPSGPKIVQLPDDYKAPQGFFSLLNQKVKNAATWLYLLLFKAEQQKSLHQSLVEATQEKKNV